jgi:hypothetical protein
MNVSFFRKLTELPSTASSASLKRKPRHFATITFAIITFALNVHLLIGVQQAANKVLQIRALCTPHKCAQVVEAAVRRSTSIFRRIKMQLPKYLSLSALNLIDESGIVTVPP